MAEDDERYFMEGHRAEIQRLTIQHEVIKHHMGMLVLAPIEWTAKVKERGAIAAGTSASTVEDQELRILDSATADGFWLRDLLSSLPSGSRPTFIGTDISEHYFPPRTSWPDNLSLQIQSITKPWPNALHNSFDLVHQRFALPAAGNAGVKDALKGLVSLIKPGGWIQLVEADHSLFTEPAMGELFELVKEVFGAMNVPWDLGRQLKEMLEAEGLVNVEEKIYDIPLGAKNDDNEMGRKGAAAFVMGAEGLVGAARQFPSSTFPAQRLNKLKSWVEAELANHGGLNRVYVVWAQRRAS